MAYSYKTPDINLTLNYKIMKKAIRSSEETRNLDQLISKLSENEILSTQAMSFIRGGEGEGLGGEVVISIPKTKS